ncbi:arginine--tRNA ligase [Neomegalonema sp.]|uniref:arginine--tRNA ligase n=1 Tax=Neomegalonema sp. TaxID=2039713 RepID=UPI00260905DB|nr:arginine--tRNA ligase [Neomegalonema sp.]MDD2870060.1 arginine--tRNA ligase [Neomegalonema sp.]
MTVFADFRSVVLDALAQLQAEGRVPSGLDTAAVAMETPRDPAHGDLATNAALVLARPAKLAPRALAEALAEKLRAHPQVRSAEPAGPGFLNLRVDEAVWRAELREAIDLGAGWGRSEIGAGKSVDIEFVSANPTGPLHVGHMRGAVFGDALANLLQAAGWEVTREYYINDAGGQVDTLARSAYLRYLEAHDRSIEIPEGLYPGEYLRDVGAALRAQFGDRFVDQPEEAWLEPIRDFAVARMMDEIREDLAALNIHMDLYSSEKAIAQSGAVEQAIGRLEEMGLIYRGVLEPPKGKLPEDWEPREQTLFRSTAYGDDVDRPIRKSGGSWTYFAPDIAYHYDKTQRGYDLLVDVLGADHGGYVKRLKAAVAALTEGRVPLEARLCQMVNLFKNGQPYKMSKRSGNFVTLRDVIDEVGPDVARFVMLMRKNDAQLDFDFDKALEQSRDNPVWYVQYAHARTASLARQAQEAGFLLDDAGLATADADLLDHPSEMALIRKIAEFPRHVEGGAQAQEPHRIAFYLYDLAGVFHALWSRGKEEEELRFVQASDPEGTRARLALVRATQLTLANGMRILGVTPMDEMR